MRHQHSRILALTRQLSLEARRPARDFDAHQLHRTLEALKQILVRHLAIEDARLYPPLLSSPDPRVASLARSVFEETGRLRESFAVFESRWRTSEAIAEDTASFLFELRSLAEVVTQRILVEDNLLCFANACEEVPDDEANAA